MTPSPASPWRFEAQALVGCQALAVALASSCLLPLAAMAVPIQATNGASAPASAATAGTTEGPRRPGAISPPSPGPASGSSAGVTPGPRRPTLNQSLPLTATN